MLTRLPKKHLLVDAAILFSFGLFQAAMTYLGADMVNRPHIDTPYALAEFTDWLVDLIGRTAAAIFYVVAFGALAAVLLRAARPAPR